MSTNDQNWVRVCEWVSQMQFLAMLAGISFELPIPLERENLDSLVDFMANHNNNAMKALNAIRSEIKGN